MTTNRLDLAARVLGLVGVPARPTTPIVATAPIVQEWVIVCPTCELDVPGYADEAEAGHLAGVHNDLHHGSRPEAFTAPVTEPSAGRRGGFGGLG